jgi:uncharacterized protein
MTSTLDTILLPTLERIRSLYDSTAGTHAGRLRALVVKPGWNVVLGTEGQHGAAMNFCGYEGSTLDTDEIRTWVGMPLLDVAQLGMRRASWHERSVGIASLSALSQPFLTPDALTARGIAVVDRDFAQHLEKEDRVALVGFGGVVSRLRGRCRELHVTDLRPRDAFQSMVIAETITYSPDWVHVHGPEDNAEVLGGADAVAITGSALVNGTMATLLEYSRRARLVSVYGASAAFIPDVLFERGVHLVQAHRVSEPRAFEEGMLEEMNLEPTIQRTQTFQTLRRNAS